MFPRVPADRRGSTRLPAPREAVDGRGPWLPAALHASAHREGRPEAGKGHRDPGEGSGALSEAGGLTHTPTQQLTAEKTKTNC